MRTWRPAAATRAARRDVRGRTSLEAADGNDLVPGPDSDGEGAGPAAEDGVGAVVERLKGWDDAAPTDPDEALWNKRGIILLGDRLSLGGEHATFIANF